MTQHVRIQEIPWQRSLSRSFNFLTGCRNASLAVEIKSIVFRLEHPGSINLLLGFSDLT